MHHMLAPGGTITHQHSSSSSSKSNSKGNVNASSNNIIMYSPHVAAESVPVRRAAPGGAVSQQPSPVPVKNASLVLHHKCVAATPVAAATPGRLHTADPSVAQGDVLGRTTEEQYSR